MFTSVTQLELLFAYGLIIDETWMSLPSCCFCFFLIVQSAFCFSILHFLTSFGLPNIFLNSYIIPLCIFLSACLRAGFLSLSTTDILGQIIFCCGGCPVHCKIFSSIPRLYLLYAWGGFVCGGGDGGCMLLINIVNDKL